MKGLFVEIPVIGNVGVPNPVLHSGAASETALLAAVALLCLTICPRAKGIMAAAGCLVIDQALQWHRIDDGCGKPIHMWLLGAYGFAWICCVGCHTAAKQCKCEEIEVGYCQLFESKGFALVLATVLPLSLFSWSALGAHWLSDILNSDECALDGGHPSIVFVVTSMVLLGLGAVLCAIISGQAWLVSQSVARGSAAMLAIADDDFIERWGTPNPVLQEDLSRGLTPAQLETLPCGEGLAFAGESCVICLCPVADDERIRKLPTCSHLFHRCCVDQWLLRCASCPTCKAAVLSN